MSDLVPPAIPAARPYAICLNMIVRNEAHIVHEVLNAVAPYISYWVIVDTGSDDGTQDVIRNYMARLNIPGELHERPWHDFGHNRTEALQLARGHGDYIWVIDADDTITGTIDFSRLNADVYSMRYLDTNGDNFWVPQLFRDSIPVHWVGVTHEYAAWESACSHGNLDGDYEIADRHLSARNVSGTKLTNDRDLLLSAVEDNPDDARSVFYLAQTYWCMNDFEMSLRWYTRRVELGGWEEEIFFSMLRIAESMRLLGRPWSDVQDAYLRAWEYRPVRAEPLYCLASWCRSDGRYQLGYEYAKLAAEIPHPEGETLFVRQSIYLWRALDDQAVCASWTGRQPEAFKLWRAILAKPDVPEEDRKRIAANRDICVPTMLEAAAAYPHQAIQDLMAARSENDTTVTIVAGSDPERLQRTVNTFLNCCLDAPRRAMILVVDTGLPPEDRERTLELYPFITLHSVGDSFSAPNEPRFLLNELLPQVATRYWMHIPEGARFFAPEELLTRLVGVLTSEPLVYQVGVNIDDAAKLTGSCASEAVVRRAVDGGRYLYTDRPALGPALFDTARLMSLQSGSKMGTASLDEVLCIAM